MIEGLGLTLRPWRAGDAADLVAAAGDEAMLRWTGVRTGTPETAAAWLDQQRQGWADGSRCSFAVIGEPSGDPGGKPRDGGERGGGTLLGNVVLKRGGRAPEVAEVGYWTVAAARGRGVASRAVRVLAGWAWAEHPRLRRLELFHRSDNPASCRVAVKGGFAYERTLPPRLPDPHDGHLHARQRRGPL